jgi:hypothetical protein
MMSKLHPSASLLSFRCVEDPGHGLVPGTFVLRFLVLTVVALLNAEDFALNLLFPR